MNTILFNHIKHLRHIHFITFIFFAFCITSCSSEEERDSSVYKDKETFENYLTERINSYVEKHASELVNEQTNIFTLQPVRMFKHSFFEEDDFRKGHWYKVASDNGLCSDSINSMINREIDVYNTYHGSNDSVVSITESEVNIRINEQIEHINVVPFNQDEIIDENAYATIEKLEYFGAYDLIDILIGPLITFGIGWLFGFIIGYIWSLIFHPSEEAIVGMAKVIGYLFMILWAGLFCWLTYKYIAISMDLENIISSNIINALIF